MSTYRVNIKPLEKYTFGTEIGARFEGVSDIKESYIITTSLLPDQTTILGTLRYIVLQHKDNLLNTDFKYKGKENKLEASIGPESFVFQKQVQNFGKIKKISPLFLSKDDEIFIKNPFNNTAEKQGYIPMKMTETIRSSWGRIHMPEYNSEGYIAKNGYGSGFISLSTKKIVSEVNIFRKHLLSCNQIKLGKENQEGAFYRIETVSMAKDYVFSVYVEAEDDAFPEKTIAYMGRKNNAFQFSFQKMLNTEINSLIEQVKDVFDVGERWIYALSDIYIGESAICYKDYAIAEEKYIRNLKTDIHAESYVKKRRRGERFHLIRAGSVFYNEAPNIEENENCKQIGYNILVELGGKSK